MTSDTNFDMKKILLTLIFFSALAAAGQPTGQGPFIYSKQGSSIVAIGFDTARAFSQSVLGTIYSRTNFTSIGDFTAHGTNPTVLGGAIVFSGGAGTLDRSLDLNYFNGLEKWTMVADLTAGPINATNYGLGLGIRSYSSYGKFDAVGSVNFTNTTTNGQLSQYADGQSIATSTANLVASQGNHISLSVERNKNVITVSAYNITTGSVPVTSSYTYNLDYPTIHNLPNFGRFAIFDLANSQNTVNSLTIFSDAIIGADLMLEGDSKKVGYIGGGSDKRLAALLGRVMSVEVNAGGYDGVQEFVQKTAQIISLKPKASFVSIGSNDIRSGVLTAQQIYDLYDTGIARRERAGIPCYHELPLYEASINQTGLKNHILATYPPNRIVDTKSEIFSVNYSAILAPDGVHGNEFLNQIEYNAIIQSGYFKNYRPQSAVGGTVVNNYSANSAKKIPVYSVQDSPSDPFASGQSFDTTYNWVLGAAISGFAYSRVGKNNIFSAVTPGLSWDEITFKNRVFRIVLPLANPSIQDAFVVQTDNNNTANNSATFSSNINVGIGTSTPLAKLDISTTTSGFLPPRMTTTQRDSMSNPAEGMKIYNLTTHHENTYDGTAWRELTYTP